MALIAIVAMIEIIGGLIAFANAHTVMNEIEGILALGFGVLTLAVVIVGVSLGKLIEGLPAAIRARPKDTPRSKPFALPPRKPVEPPAPAEPPLRTLTDIAGPRTDYVNPKFRRH